MNKEENTNRLMHAARKMSTYASHGCKINIEPSGKKEFIITLTQKVEVHPSAHADLVMGFCTWVDGCGEELEV